MLTTSELVCMNAFYMVCAITCSKISRWDTQPPTRHKGKLKESVLEASPYSFVECVFIIWNCLYIATLLCVLWQLVFQSQFTNIKYLCSWFVLFQMAFYCSFLVSYVACMDGISRVINVILFPIINSLSWIICVVCLSERQSCIEFRDIKYFTVHILPVVAASFHEIWIYTFAGFLPTAQTNKIGTVWVMYCPALVLTLYALTHDQVEVYNHQLKPPNPWFVAVLGVFSNARLVHFPFKAAC